MSNRYLIFDSAGDLLLDISTEKLFRANALKVMAGVIFDLEDSNTFRVLGPLDSSQITRRGTDRGNGDFTSWNGIVFGRKTNAAWKLKFQVKYSHLFRTS